MKCLKRSNLKFFFCKKKEKKKKSAMSSQNYNIQSQSVMQLNSAFNVKYHHNDETSELHAQPAFAPSYISSLYRSV